MKRRATVMLVWFALVSPVHADDFSTVVKEIETRYGVRPSAPHFIGFVLFLARPATWGSGVSALKVAAFEDRKLTSTPSLQDLDGIMLASLCSKWRPFVHVDSRRDGEATVIYTEWSDKHMRMFIASAGHHGIALVQMKLKAKSVKRWMANPTKEAQSTHSH